MAESEGDVSEDDSEDELATVEKMNPDEVARVHFFSIIEKDKAFYQPVVKSSDLEMLLEDGQPDDTCLSNTIMAGTPVIRHGVKNEALGIEQVSLLDVGDALACNRERVWVDSRALRVTTNFPAR